LVDVDAAHGGRKNADGGEDGEAPADAVGDFEGFVTFPGGDVAEGAAFGVGGGEDVVFITLAQIFQEQVAKENELRGGFGGFAGFADDVDDGFFDFGVIRSTTERIWSGSTLSSTKSCGPERVRSEARL